VTITFFAFWIPKKIGKSLIQKNSCQKLGKFLKISRTKLGRGGWGILSKHEKLLPETWFIHYPNHYKHE
jgi:hypothetical protein